MDYIPTVSVVIPTYNDATYLDRLLLALSKQKHTSFEVIISDANSNDKTKEVVNYYKDRLTIELVQNPPAGPGVGRNQGAEVARGEWLLFLDADDDIDDTRFINTLTTETEKHSWNTSTAKVKHRDANFMERFGSALNYNYIKLLSHTKHPVAPGWCILTKKSVFNEVGGFDLGIRFGEDYDYVIRASKNGFGFVENTSYYVDLRRSREEGIKFFLKGVANEIYRHTHRYKIKKNSVTYDFGTHKELGISPAGNLHNSAQPFLAETAPGSLDVVKSIPHSPEKLSAQKSPAYNRTDHLRDKSK